MYSVNCLAVGTAVSLKSKTFTTNQKIDYFDSKPNDRVYFNPTESVGVGTICYWIRSFLFFRARDNHDLFRHKGFIEDHPFETNQKLTFNQNGIGAISISTSNGNSI